jgi:hypothetical protein
MMEKFIRLEMSAYSDTKKFGFLRKFSGGLVS